MGQQGESDAVVELRQLWHRWMCVVWLFARRRRRRKRVDPHAYEALHADLVEAIRALVAQSHDEERAYFEALERLALPWMSLKSFKIADRDILDDLMTRCRQIERELGGRSLWLPDLARHGWLTFTLIYAIAVVVMFQLTGQTWSPLFVHGRTWSEMIQIAFDRTHYVSYLLVPFGIAIVASSIIVSRVARH